MAISKDKLIYDESDLQSSDQVGANILGDGGQRVTSSAVGSKQALDVAVVNGMSWDEIVTTFPSDSSDLFTYKLNSVAVQTVLVTYQDLSLIHI